ncbi:MAG: hypothetical protein HOK41_00645 [Nitrospina sp.]|jgi:hypothetical protein|nr:hypothetical protein [Nitrospina sp.]MBT6717048.1 hypothetical protein [Nitrospina sp.]
MTTEIIRDVLAWCSLFNVGLLLIWVLWFIFAHDWLYRFHGQWFKLSVEKFDAIHYAGIACLKIGILFFNIAPYLAFRILE